MGWFFNYEDRQGLFVPFRNLNLIMLMKKLFTFLLITIGFSSFAQDTLSYKSYRSVWSIIPRFGVGDKDTRNYFTTYGSIGLRKEFSLSKLISLNATAAYSSAYGSFGNSNLNVLGAGGGITVYPFPFVSDIVGKLFPGLKRNYSNYNDAYIDITAEVNLNNTKYSSAGNVSGPRVEANFGRFKIGKKLFLSPRFGFQGLSVDKSIPKFNISDLALFKYAGVAFGFNPKKK